MDSYLNYGLPIFIAAPSLLRKKALPFLDERAFKLDETSSYGMYSNGTVYHSLPLKIMIQYLPLAS